jgi:DNA repair exonuclease SbcCD ATPase subunit
MSEIRRYTVCCHLASEKSYDGPHQYLVQGDSGPYVLWEDHHDEVERLTELLTAERQSIPTMIDSMTSQLRATVDRVTGERFVAQAEVERLQEARDDHRAEVERLKNAIDHLTSERDEARAEVERLTARHSEMEIHITCLTDELHRRRSNGITLRWVEGEVEQLTAQRDAAEAEVERLKELLTEESKSLPKLIDSMTSQLRATADRVTAERDAARAEVERLTAERDTAQAEVELLTRAREALRDSLREALIERNDARYEAGQLRREQSAQKLDMVANCKETLTSSRPDDETIWRELFMALCGQSLKEGYMIRAESADAALAVYRKRWPL